MVWAGSAQAAVTLYGLTREDSGRVLVSFNSETPGVFNTSVALTGAANAQTKFFSLDLNTSNNTLYSIGSLRGTSQYALYRIGYDGTASVVGSTLGVNISTEDIGLDYDSAAGVFRVVTGADQVYTVDPNTGVATLLGEFNYDSGDPRGMANPNVVAAGYGGQLYVLDRNARGAGTSLLSTLDGTTLTSRAVIGLSLNANTSFDIAANGEAYFNSGQLSDRLYRLDLGTGGFVDKGALRAQLTGLTAGGPAVTAPVPEPAGWATMILGAGVVGGSLRRRRRDRGALA